uniref:Uncharacterized protein n=1 Tax=Aegilops tauschii subsp. strangulata TaxID=200361 RepID=A0A453KWA2_AEGTS
QTTPCATPPSPKTFRKPPRQPPTATRPRPRNRTPTPAPDQDGAAEQHHDRDPERHHLPPLGADPGGGYLAARARRRHRVRAVPGGAGHRPGGLPHARLHRGACRRLLPRDMPPLVLPRRHVPAHRRPPRHHRLRLRRHAQGHRRGRLRPRVQGVPARGLLHLAAEAGGERQELEQDQGVPPGRQGLQVARGQEGHGPTVHVLRSLPHPVRLLQASDQLRLHLRQRHAVERPGQVDGARLRCVVQRRRGALLRLPVVQGRRGGHAQAQLEALRHHQHRLPRLHRHRLLRRLLRLQEQPPRPPQRRRVQAAGRVRLIARLARLFIAWIGWMRSSRRVMHLRRRVSLRMA